MLKLLGAQSASVFAVVLIVTGCKSATHVEFPLADAQPEDMRVSPNGVAIAPAWTDPSQTAALPITVPKGWTGRAIIQFAKNEKRKVTLWLTNNSGDTNTRWSSGQPWQPMYSTIYALPYERSVAIFVSVDPLDPDETSFSRCTPVYFLNRLEGDRRVRYVLHIDDACGQEVLLEPNVYSPVAVIWIDLKPS